ncbi:MAG: hypothetical protein M3R06_03255, partial [Chloroflexota bacterium]|nr:hypothetical protein [Chloroflexota bacterium]
EQAFPEFRYYLGECFYADCTHLHEPNCAIRSALEGGHIAPARYESFAILRRGGSLDLASSENKNGP